MLSLISEIPSPPLREEWLFLQELRQPEQRCLRWQLDKGAAPPDHLDLRPGLTLLRDFPDPEGLLETAYDDLRKLLALAGLPEEGAVPCRFKQANTGAQESFCLQIDANGITLSAADTEGLRRGIYFLEEQLTAATAPFIPFAELRRQPWLRNRISRCFFGPIKRPPFNRDELLDEMDYYPDEYLNRLAHEGINGLWLTIVFRELAQTSFSKRDPLAEKRLEKLRRTVEQCRRYGIKTWLFSIEPKNLALNDPLLLENPEFGGAFTYDDNRCFCPSSEKARQYLYESVYDIFSKVPHLGGLINISHGERSTTCLSTVAATDEHPIKCPRCSQIPKWQIHHHSTSAMIKGMKAANPDAELISWLYQPQPTTERGAWTYELARHLPEGVILQYNFESGACKKQLSRARLGGDYWLSYVGPSHSFSRVAEGVINSSGELSAKIQVGCSHEVATVPFVPVPGLLFQKYHEMKKHGCRHVMQCWYFGNYPGVMNRASGILAFNDLTGTEDNFLLELARPQWGKHAEVMAAAWRLFSDAYSEYPLSNDMQYYGPMHAGPVWPLHLKVELAPLAPTWKPDFPPSGDAIGECLENHTIEEALLLASRMQSKFDEGLLLLKDLRELFKDDRERLLDLCVAEALGLHFRSARNILEFYLLRREFYFESDEKKLQLLERMRKLVQAEIDNSGQLALLCRQDSRLGFHSEAEAHQYCESRLAWRQSVLQKLLDDDFAAFEQALAKGEALPQSDFCRQTATYRLNSGWIGDENTRWQIERLANDDLRVTLQGRKMPCERDFFFFNCVDATGTTFPCMITIKSDGSVRQLHPRAECKVSQSEEFWTASIFLPSLLWNREPSIEPRFVYIARSVETRDDPEPKLRYDWPEHEQFPRHRLNISVYQGNYCGKLIG
jgi:hypothetical protein